MELKRSNRSCCVMNCNNTEKNSVTNLNIKFYSFPGRYYEEERKQQWIIAINRRNADGSLWQPTPSSRICSEHFVGGKKSDKLTDPSYIPSIFSFRKMARVSGKTSMTVENFTKVRKVYSLAALKKILNGTSEAATQVNFEYDKTSFVFCSSPDDANYNCKFVECNIGYNVFNCRPSKEVSCGPCGMFLSDALCKINKRKTVKLKKIKT